MLEENEVNIMIDERKLIEEFKTWDMQDLYLPAHFIDLVEEQPKVEPVREGYLQERYITSVDSGLVWTEEHIKELCYNFYLIIKEAHEPWKPDMFGNMNVEESSPYACERILERLEELKEEYSPVEENGMHNFKWCAICEAIDIVEYEREQARQKKAGEPWKG